MPQSENAERGTGRKLLWFAGIWLASILVLACVAGLIKVAIGVTT